MNSSQEDDIEIQENNGNIENHLNFENHTIDIGAPVPSEGGEDCQSSQSTVVSLENENNAVSLNDEINLVPLKNENNVATLGNEDDTPLIKPEPVVNNVPIKKKSTRLYWADCARIFSMLAIIFLHCSGYGCEQELRKDKNSHWIIVCWYNCLTRFGVPMFVLLSGTFILDPSKNFTFKKLFTRNIFRLVTAFVFWSTVNALFNIYVFKRNSLSEFFKMFLVGEEYLWFIFMIIGCYLISPFLRLFSDNIVLARYFLGLCLFWGSIVPSVKDFLHISELTDIENELILWTDRWHYHFTLEFVGYFVAGYHIVKHVNIRSLYVRLILYALCIADIIFICYATYMMERDDTKYSKEFRDTNTITVVIYAIVFFIFFKHEVGRINFSPRAIKIISKLSALTFGVYLSHMIIKQILIKFLNIGQVEFFGKKYSPIIGCPILWIIITIISYFPPFKCLINFLCIK